jgi:hypothetical protein
LRIDSIIKGNVMMTNPPMASIVVRHPYVSRPMPIRGENEAAPREVAQNTIPKPTFLLDSINFDTSTGHET